MSDSDIALKAHAEYLRALRDDPSLPNPCTMVYVTSHAVYTLRLEPESVAIISIEPNPGPAPQPIPPKIYEVWDERGQWPRAIAPVEAGAPAG